MNTIKIGIIREGKHPPDRRVVFTPAQCRRLLEMFPGLEIIVQSYKNRAYPDKEYALAGIDVANGLSHCDILMGIKEVPVEDLISGKKYMFFSHTIKKQAHNRKLLQAALKKNIELIDYECLTDSRGFRVLGFGRYAGIAGAYNAILALGKKYGIFQLKRACMCSGRDEMNNCLSRVKLPGRKIVITGEGRVAGGAVEIMNALHIKKVAPADYLVRNFDEPVYCQLGVTQYNQHIDGKQHEESDFFLNPGNYISAFTSYARVSDVFLSCHFWDPRAPKLFTLKDMKEPGFSIKVIADISCDINGSVPSTVRASSIDDPFYGFDPATGPNTEPFRKDCITVMAIDNLPNEMPRESSEDFGNQLIEHVIPHLLGSDRENMIAKATITRNGALTERFQYLSDFAA